MEMSEIKTSSTTIRKLKASEGNVIISKSEINSPDISIPIPECIAEELLLGSEASAEDFKEVSKAEIEALLERYKAELEKLNAQSVNEEEKDDNN